MRVPVLSKRRRASARYVERSQRARVPVQKWCDVSLRAGVGAALRLTNPCTQALQPVHGHTSMCQLSRLYQPRKCMPNRDLGRTVRSPWLTDSALTSLSSCWYSGSRSLSIAEWLSASRPPAPTAERTALHAEAARPRSCAIIASRVRLHAVCRGLGGRRA